MNTPPFNLTTVIKLTPGIVIYVLTGVGSVYVNNYGVELYLTYVGPFTSRGVSSGSAVYLAYDILIVTNVLIFFLPKLYAKLIAIAVMAALLLWILLPDYPIRAMAYSSFTACVSIVALSGRWAVERLLFRSDVTASGDK